MRKLIRSEYIDYFLFLQYNSLINLVGINDDISSSRNNFKYFDLSDP